MMVRNLMEGTMRWLRDGEDCSSTETTDGAVPLGWTVKGYVSQGRLMALVSELQLCPACAEAGKR